MTLKSLNSSAIVTQITSGTKTSQPPIEAGALVLSQEVSQRALEKMLESDETPYKRTLTVEDGVNTLVPLQAKYSKDFEIAGYDIDTTNVSNDNLQAAYRAVLTSLVPLPVDKIKERLGIMAMIITLPKDFSPKVLAMKTEILAEKLHEYPADILLHTFDYIEKHNRFWPTLAEFHEHCSWQVRPRRLMKEVLHKCIASRT